MRIVLVLSSMATGGAERVAASLANAWAASGHEVLMLATFSGGGQSFYELDSRVRLIFLADVRRRKMWRWPDRFRRLWMLRRIIANQNPNVVVSFLTDVNVACVLATRFLSVPLVVCERTDPFASSMSRLLRVAQWLLYPLADAVVVQTEAVRRKYFDRNWRTGVVEVIPNPIPKALETRIWSRRQRLARKIIAVGRFDAGKQFDVLLEIFSSLVAIHNDCKLRIIGDGPLRDDLEAAARRLGISPQVEFPGLIRDIGYELADADIFVMTSRQEGFPNVLLEAMASGLPCVAMDCPSGPREISLDGAYARLVPLGDSAAFLLALCELITDDEMRQQLGASARLSVLERYRISVVMKQWDRLFDKLIG